MRHSWDVSFCLLQAFLENEDLGNSLGSVEALRQKHDDFEEAFTAQEEKSTVRNGPWFGDWLHFFFFQLYNIVLVLPYIKMTQPQVYMLIGG